MVVLQVVQRSMSCCILDGITAALASLLLTGRDRVIMSRSVCDVQVELPRVSPLYKGRPYRYAYAGSARLPTTVVNALTKFDVKAGTSKSWFEQGALPTGETHLLNGLYCIGL